MGNESDAGRRRVPTVSRTATSDPGTDHSSRLAEKLMAFGTVVDTRRSASWTVLGVMLAVIVPAGRASAQAEVRNLTQPIPVVNPGGHSGPVRALLFAPPDG